MTTVASDPLQSYNLTLQDSLSCTVPTVWADCVHVAPFCLRNAAFRVVDQGSCTIIGKDLLHSDLSAELYHLLRLEHIEEEESDPILNRLPLSILDSCLFVTPVEDPTYHLAAGIDNAKTQKILSSFPLLFDQMRMREGLRVVPVHIPVIRDPHSTYTPQSKRNIDPKKAVIFESEVKALKELGFVEEVSEAYYCCNCVIVKQGSKHRVCFDLTNVNQVIISNLFPLPKIPEVILALRGKKVFATLDLVKGFYQLPLHPDSRHLTAFFGPGNRMYQFTRVPFGMKNAPSNFQAAMQEILRPLLGVGCLVYIDDVVVYGVDEAEFFKHLAMVLQLLQDGGATLNLEKCHFGLSQIEYLGYVLSGTDYALKKERYITVAGLPQPKTVSSLRSFLGALSAFRDFVPNFALWEAKLSSKAATTLSGKAKLTWGDEEEEAYGKLKSMVSTAEYLQMPDPTQPFVVFTDASLAGTGGLILQRSAGGKAMKLPLEGLGMMSPVAVYSHANNDTERRYTVTELEMLAVVRLFDKHRDLLLSNSVILYTDHRNLVFITDPPSKKIHRWRSFLAEFNIDFRWVAGKDNAITDYLSRNCIPDDGGVDLQEEGGVDDITRKLAKVNVISSVGPHTVKDASHVVSTDSLALVATVVPSDSSARPSDSSARLSSSSSSSSSKKASSKRSKSFAPAPNSSATSASVPLLSYSGSEPSASSSVSPPTLPSNSQLKAITDAIFSKFHSDLSGHHGIDTTLKMLKSHGLNWENMEKQLSLFVKSCKACQLGSYRRNVVSDGQNITFYPWEKMHLDHVFFPDTHDEYKYVLVATDAFSRYTELTPAKEATTAEYLRVLLEVIYPRYGLPACIVTDHGSAFTSALSEEFAKYMGFEHLFTTPGNSPDNGTVEVTNKFIKSHLVKIFAQRQGPRDWRSWIPIVQRVLNFSYSPTLGTYPARLLFGDALQSIQLPFPRLFPRERMEKSTADYIKALNQDLQEVLLAVTTSRIKALKNREKRIGKRSKVSDIQYSPGDPILIQRKGLSNKLDPLWSGPFEVVDTSQSSVTVRNPLTNTTRTFPKSHSKPFYVPDENRPKASAFSAPVLDNSEFEVDEILEHFPPKGDHNFKKLDKTKFRVKWTGYEDTTVESYKDVKMSEAFIRYMNAVAPAEVLEKLEYYIGEK